MTLDEMLALLPDNTTGDISAASLRAIVTDLFNVAHAIGGGAAYDWTTQAIPGTGKLSLDQGWSTGSTVMHLAEVTSDGALFGFGAIDAGTTRFLGRTQSGGTLRADKTGPSVDQGAYRDVPVQVTEATGTPANNELVELTVVVAP